MADVCVRSILQFGRGLFGVTVAAPRADEIAVRQIFKDRRVNLSFFDEPAGHGFNCQQCVKCEADKYAPGFEHYIHIDSDWMFLKPFDVSHFFVRPGRPIWYYGEYSKLITPQNWPLRNWQMAVSAAVGTQPKREYMRKFPIVIPAPVYAETRRIIERRHKMPFSEYVFSCSSAFPQTFAEFNTLGFIADINGHNVEFVNWEQARDWGLCAGFHGPAGIDFKMPHGPAQGKSMREIATQLKLL